MSVTNTPGYRVVSVANWAEAKAAFAELPMDWAFRGQRRTDWRLQTSLERVVAEWSSLEQATAQVVEELEPLETERLEGLFNQLSEQAQQALEAQLSQAFNRMKLAELFAMQRFTGSAHHYLTENLVPANKLEWLALMQHHGAPTRLLDWTLSPYVAAYFALEDASSTCAVWAIDVVWCRAQGIRSLRLKDPSRGTLTDWSKDDFDRVVAMDVPGVFPVIPPRQNVRLTTQQGLFLALGDSGKSFEENLLSYGVEELGDHVCKIEIPMDVRGEALGDLYRMNINRSTLFPGLDGFAQSIRHRLLLEGNQGYHSQQIQRATEIGTQFGSQLLEGFLERLLRQTSNPDRVR